MDAEHEGDPQGATASPMLANIYLHYVLDLWVDPWRRRYARGDVIIVRYADDFLVGFQYHADAVRFLGELRERLRRFALELHPDKTRLLAFGLYAQARQEERGLKGNPETFNFLGFTHACGGGRLDAGAYRRRLRAASGGWRRCGQQHRNGCQFLI